jgi:organic radical activating enzyme
MSKKSVKLIENFVSWQGEGPDSGQAMIILRFKTCNRHCSWCDTQVKMRISAEAEYKLSDIQQTIIETRSGLLITGGEPTVDKHFNGCLALINDLNYPIANVESNGYKLYELINAADPDKPVNFIYSPKIFSNSDLLDAQKLTSVLTEQFSEEVFIKVVYEDTDEIRSYLAWLSGLIGDDVRKFNRVWLMPEGTNRSDLIRNSAKVFDACETYRFNFSSRNHIIFGFV